MNRLILGISMALAWVWPGFAHTVQRAGNVAALWHVEPNHNPRAGQPAQVWVALTRRGGNPIFNREVACTLAIRQEPQGNLLLTTPLRGINVERYRDTPAAQVTFPQPGRYQLRLTCQPKAANLKPFEFSYPITVGR
ncbi:hypothetical protein GlitD10_2414 [Gloeomargarita lithophora Alchichica-D10]|uniref:Uncharacterized protein n=1 Tax=Gloeomargarita lithophora Alchichica-D10 TaxID=1188229 RepID=A0A1J0AFN7_9CYAN|nr:hypothetical protein [Gloeomargarita lithophora]APB34748.1 hypothetical protein GlitD10_2414 [Gloeomargarita lithophora Alchichica-D10]